MNFYRETDEKDFSGSQTRSYWPSNWTVNLVGEETQGFNTVDPVILIRQSFGFEMKEDGRIDCDSVTGKYYPLLYLNDNL